MGNRPCIETKVYYSGNATTSLKIRKITNQLYNVKVEFDIPNYTGFGTTAIIDTGASACCINKKVIPKEALEPLTQTVVFNGLNLRQQATHRIKQGYFLIKEKKFKIPLIYAFDMRDNNGIEMLIGANFLRSMKGGIQIEGDEITIYKKVTKIKTSNQTKIAEIAELEQGYIGKESLKHWKKNGEPCKLDIINPDIIIKDKPLKHVTLAMEELFRKHVDSLLKIGVIRPSKSRHRTMAMIINSGTTIDPVTGREVKGKERMVRQLILLEDPYRGSTDEQDRAYRDLDRTTCEETKNLWSLLEDFRQLATKSGRLYFPSTTEKLFAKLPPSLSKRIEESFRTKHPGLSSGVLPAIKFTHSGSSIIPKTNAHEDKRLKPSDYELDRKIKEQVQNLPDLEIPPENAHIILETDGCMEGWVGIVKWKKGKEDPRSSERIYAYASGKFSTTQSTIDAEINACINTLEKLKIYYLDKQEVTLRTDCQAIISFYNKTNSNKSSRVRWIKMHRRNEGISSSNSLLSGGSSTVP
ncbi:Orf y [Tanacetum coccineum]